MTSPPKPAGQAPMTGPTVVRTLFQRLAAPLDVERPGVESLDRLGRQLGAAAGEEATVGDAKPGMLSSRGT